jgi:hypothetical protein
VLAREVICSARTGVVDVCVCVCVLAGGELEALFAVYGLLAGCHLAFSHRALSNVRLTTLSRQRLNLILGSFHERGAIVAPEDVEERIILPARDHYTPPIVVMGASLRDVVSSAASTPSLFSSLISRFLPFLPSSTPSTSATSTALLRDLIELHRSERFVVRYRPSDTNGGRVLVVLHEDAGSEDILRAYFTAFHLRMHHAAALGVTSTSNAAIIDKDGHISTRGEDDGALERERASIAYTQANYDKFVEQLGARGWTRNVVLASGAYRARW